MQHSPRTNCCTVLNNAFLYTTSSIPSSESCVMLHMCCWFSSINALSLMCHSLLFRPFTGAQLSTLQHLARSCLQHLPLQKEPTLSMFWRHTLHCRFFLKAFSLKMWGSPFPACSQTHRIFLIYTHFRTIIHNQMW